ncbi:asparagine synthase-related protein [Streptomyces sp. NPDC048665]|uniref:asparagine synthetase B family protein n=1 Tax=Streptomyces sp. NPDC048665 TaxID=3155490 RepID=UPI00341300B9
MASDLVVRGRAGGTVWQERQVALIQRDSAQAPQPPRSPQSWRAAVVTDDLGDTLAVAVCDGHVLPPSDLDSPTTGSDMPVTGGSAAARAVLKAYLRWGRSAPAHLDGTFAFAVWDVRTGELLLGRDRLGVKPLSYALTPEGVVFASDVATVVRHPMVRAELDGAGLGAVLTQLRSPGLGVLRSVREVRAGHTLCIAAEGRTEEPYWRLEARPHELGLDSTVKHLRDLLEDAVARVEPGERAAVLLSGGLDSSVLTGLVASGGRSAPQTFTVLFGDTSAPVPDRPYAEEVVRLWGCDHREVAVRPDELLDPVTLAEVLAAKDQPTPFGDKNITPYLFSGHVARHARVVLSGEGADALFGGLGGAIDEGRVLTSFPWIERSRRFGMPYGIGTGLFDRALLEDVDVDGHVDRMFREALDEVPHLPGAAPVDRLARQVDYLTVTRLLEQTVLHSERLSTAAGLEVRFPFTDHRLLSVLFNVPAAMKSFDGREKSLLRTLGRDVVPPSVLTRAKVPYPITYDPHYKAGLVGRLRDLLDDTTAPARPLVDLPAIRRTTEDPALLDRGGWLGRADAEMVLQLDDWMRRLNVRTRV